MTRGAAKPFPAPAVVYRQMSRSRPGARAPKRRRGGPAAATPPEAELEILACLHDRGEMDARSVGALLRASRPLSHSSVVTLLRRLEAKGLVARRPAAVGKAFLYRASERSAGAFDGVLRRLVSRVFGGDRLSVVSTLFRSSPATEGEIDALRRLVEELHGRRKGRRK